MTIKYVKKKTVITYFLQVVYIPTQSKMRNTTPNTTGIMIITAIKKIYIIGFISLTSINFLSIR